ncbi:unnamed protein product [Meloidogyne enterolobii]|uniref:Uncharacterized protein n=1 Tax=Meloidogyne enterolobii TaxID=390850 RepID=A0ACB1AMA2_MELEN
MRSGRGFLLVYSVTDEQSFHEAKKLYQQVLRVKDRPEYPVLLVANKVDLLSQRKVSEQQGRELACELNNIPYIETSAKDPPVNVDSAFHELVSILLVIFLIKYFRFELSRAFLLKRMLRMWDFY